MPEPEQNASLIKLIVAEPDCRAWLALLADCLGKAGHRVSLASCPVSSAPSADFEAMAAMEARIYRLPGNLWEALPAPAFVPAQKHPASIRIALSGAIAASDFSIRLDGEEGIGALGSRLLNGHIPLVEIVDRDENIRAAGLPAIEELDVLSKALDHFVRRLATLIGMALDAKPRAAIAPDHLRKPGRGKGPWRYLGEALVKRAARRLAGSIVSKDHWRVGIRPARQPFTAEGDQHLDGYRWLPDDGARYYADPFLWEEDGRDFLFVEEFPYATGRGIISYTELAPDGQPLFTPRPIIERATHLSYPLMFRHDGAIYMIPENAAEGHLPLYRAKQFPQVWEDCGSLVEGVGLHDATLIAHEGAWWLMANEAREGGSSWDCLCLYRASSPLGPFTPHPANPWLVDARFARSAGPVLNVDGKLIRPIQNCLGGYGRFVHFTEITMLSEQGFAQKEHGRLLPRAGSRVAGVHSYGRNARFEVMDALTTRRCSGKAE